MITVSESGRLKQDLGSEPLQTHGCFSKSCLEKLPELHEIPLFSVRHCSSIHMPHKDGRRDLVLFWIFKTQFSGQ